MNKGIVRITIVGIFILIYQFQTFGNDYDNLQFETIFTNDGLDFPHIREVVQDGDGYIWFGTGGGGLYRYDGLTMKKFTSVYENQKTLTGNDITRFLIDSQNRFWIGSTTGLSLYNNKFENFTRLYPNKTHPYGFRSNVIQRIYEDGKGQIWVGSPGGLSKIVEQDTTFRFEHYIMSESSNDTLLYSVTDICEYDSNNLLVGTKHGLYNLQLNTSEFWYVAFDFNFPPRINSLLPDQNGKIFVGTTRGLLRIKTIHAPDTLDFELYNNRVLKNADGRFTSNNIHKLQIDYNGVLWCGSINGLNLLFLKDLTKTPQTRVVGYNQYPPQQNNNVGKDINDIYFDKEGTTWIATYSGVSKLIQKKHYFVNPLQRKEINEKYLNGDVRSVHEDNHGYLWIVYFGRGIALYNLNTKEFISFPGNILPINHIFSILIDDNNIVWIAAYNDTRGGLIRMELPPNFHQEFNFQDITFKRFHFPDKVRKPGNINFGKWIYKDKQGNIWYLTREGGACKFDFKGDILNNEPVITQYWSGGNENHYIPINNASHMVEDKNEVLWLSTRGGGFGRYNKETDSFKWYLQNPKKVNGLSQDRITCMHVDDSNKLWLATIGNGLNIFDPKTEKFSHLDTKNGLQSNNMKAMVSDQQGNIWVSSTSGLSMINTSTYNITSYNLYDGLNGLYNERVGTLTKSNKLFFGGNNGFIEIKTNKNYQKDTAIPKLVLTNLFIKGIEVKPSNEKDAILPMSVNFLNKLKLSHQDFPVTLHFSLLSFVNSHSNKYQYKLEGQQDEWIDVDPKSPHVSFNFLEGGDYTLKIKAANSKRMWSNTRELHISVTPPFWKTNWFILLIILTVAIITFLIFYFRVKFFREQNRILNEQVNSKTAELRHANSQIKSQNKKLAKQRDELIDTNSTKDKLFSIIAHDLKNPFYSIINLAGILGDKIKSGKSKSDVLTIVDYIKTSTGDVALLLENLMEWAYTRSGKITYSPTEVTLIDIVERVHRLYLSTAFKKGNDFTYHLDGNKSAIIDRDMVYTILRNLVGNAIKFTREGKVHIYIKCTNYLLIKVTDTGVGMSQKIIDKIFNLVDKEIRNGTDHEKGTGLGMVVVKEFVDFHRGKITINSELCKGTTITIEIPISQNPQFKKVSVNAG